MIYTKEQKIKIYETLPQDLKEAIISVETFEQIEKIAEKYSLMLDKVSELSDELNLLILGITKQNEFVDNISKRLEISHDQAYEISKDINSTVLDKIRDSLQQIQKQENIEEEIKNTNQIPQTQPSNVKETPRPIFSGPYKTETQPLSKIQRFPEPPKDPSTYTTPKTIEEIGNFSIEKPAPPSSSSQYNETDINREEALKSIEDKPITLVDHLLSTPVSTPQKIEVKNVSVEKKIIEEKKPDKPKTYSEDPYREPII